MSRMRLFLVWLLLAAVPLQGLAAASMLYCGMGAHHGQAQQVVPTNGAPAAAAHDHSAHGHDDVAKSRADEARQLPDATHQCGVCSACCSLVAIAGLPALHVLSASPRVEPTELLVHVRAAASPVPDKPPRA